MTFVIDDSTAQDLRRLTVLGDLVHRSASRARRACSRPRFAKLRRQSLIAGLPAILGDPASHKGATREAARRAVRGRCSRPSTTAGRRRSTRSCSARPPRASSRACASRRRSTSSLALSIAVTLVGAFRVARQHHAARLEAERGRARDRARQLRGAHGRSGSRRDRRARPGLRPHGPGPCGARPHARRARQGRLQRGRDATARRAHRAGRRGARGDGDVHRHPQLHGPRRGARRRSRACRCSMPSSPS